MLNIVYIWQNEEYDPYCYDATLFLASALNYTMSKNIMITHTHTHTRARVHTHKVYRFVWVYICELIKYNTHSRSGHHFQYFEES